MEEKKRKKYHRGRRKKRETGTEEVQKTQYKKRRRRSKKATKGSMISNIILVIAIIVFCVSGFQLFSIYKGYRDGEKEYDGLAEQVLSIENDGDKETFSVDFDALKEINSDVVGWIRFDEPAIINYPVVQGEDNDEYLYKTFQGYDNTVGTIFVNVYNNAHFEDQNTIVYGHRMNNETMFNKLAEYREEEFWQKYPYFYIYTPDGKEMKYEIYSVGVISETSDIYTHQFADDAAFAAFIEETKNSSLYDTGIEVTTDDKIVTLSTCVKERDDQRLVVIGVRSEVTQ